METLIAMAWTNFFLMIIFGIVGFIVGRISVSNRVKELDNQTNYDLEVTLDDKGILTIH